MKSEEEPLPHPSRPLTMVVATARQRLGGACGPACGLFVSSKGGLESQSSLTDSVQALGEAFVS